MWYVTSQKNGASALGLLGGVVLLAQTNQVLAGTIVFTLDSTNSVIALSGSVTLP
jgi:hypothetical protein